MRIRAGFSPTFVVLALTIAASPYFLALMIGEASDSGAALG